MRWRVPWHMHALTVHDRENEESKTASLRVAVPISRTKRCMRRSSKLGSDKTIISGWFDTIAIM
jgi:hypothetical protein